MKTEEAWKHFYSTYVVPVLDEQLDKIETYYNQHKDQLADELVQSFRLFCLKLSEKQAAGQKGKIGYITYSMRRTYLLEKKYEHQVHAYNGDWFFDKSPCLFHYDSGWAFGHLEQLESEWIKQSRMYMNKILIPDVEQIKLEKAADFNRYVIDLAQYALPLAVRLPEFQDIAWEEDLEVYAGEYKGRMDLVYRKTDDQVKLEPLRYREIL